MKIIPIKKQENDDVSAIIGDAEFLLKDIEIFEVSLVSNPAVPNAMFQLRKNADDSVEQFTSWFAICKVNKAKKQVAGYALVPNETDLQKHAILQPDLENAANSLMKQMAYGTQMGTGTGLEHQVFAGIGYPIQSAVDIDGSLGNANGFVLSDLDGDGLVELLEITDEYPRDGQLTEEEKNTGVVSNERISELALEMGNARYVSGLSESPIGTTQESKAFFKFQHWALPTFYNSVQGIRDIINITSDGLYGTNKAAHISRGEFAASMFRLALYASTVAVLVYLTETFARDYLPDDPQDDDPKQMLLRRFISESFIDETSETLNPAE